MSASSRPDLDQLSAEFCDLISLQNDVLFARDAAKRIAELDPEKDEGSVLQRSLWTSALITYRRAFAGGLGFGPLPGRRRMSVPKEMVEALPDELKAFHAEILEMADKHIAHSVNALEQISMSWGIRPEPEPPTVVGVAWFVAVHVSGIADQISQLVKMAEHLQSQIGAEIGRRKDDLIGAANKENTRSFGVTASNTDQNGIAWVQDRGRHHGSQIMSQPDAERR
jgi:hypothetical protein